MKARKNTIPHYEMMAEKNGQQNHPTSALHVVITFDSPCIQIKEMDIQGLKCLYCSMNRKQLSNPCWGLF